MPTAGMSDLELSATSPREQMLALVVDILSGLIRAQTGDIDGAVNRALAKLGRVYGVDRTHVFRLRPDDDAELIDNTHEWCRAGVPSALHLRQGLPDAMIASWRVRLEAGATVELQEGAADASLEVARLPLKDIRSMLAVPMRAGGRLTGFVGFDAMCGHRPFSADEITQLKLVADAIGTVLARSDTAHDIATGQAALAKAHDRLKTTLGALPHLVLEVDADGRYLDVHTADAGQMMVPPQDLIGRTHEEIMPPEIAELNRRAMAEVDATGQSGHHTFWADTPRGRRRYALTVSPRPTHRPGAAPTYVFISRDITEEWHLAREAERLGLIARRTTDLVMVIGLDFRIEWVNPAFEARTGWTLADVRGRRTGEVLDAPGTDRGELARMATEMAAGRGVRSELLSRTRTGEEFWTEIDIHPLHDAEGQLTGFVSIETDISRRKAQAEALERLATEATEARARLEMAVEALPDAFAYFDAENRMVLCNSRHRSLQGETEPQRATQYPHSSGATGADGDCPPDTDRDSAAEDVDAEQMRDGRWLRVIRRATADGGQVCMGIDITAVKEAEQRLADIIHGAEAGTWEWHLASGENRINARWAEMVGYRPKELEPLTIDVWRALVHPEDLASAEAKLAQVFSRNLDQFEYELRMRHKSGHEVWVLSRGRVARWSPEGAPEVMAGVHMDITALKRAEQRLAEIIDASAAGTWELDLDKGKKRVNPRWAEMLGYSLDELANRPNYGFHDLVHPEDLATLLDQHDRLAVSMTDSFANEIRMRHRNGHWVWILSRGRVVARDKVGKPIKVAGIHLDITERKYLEAQLVAERDYLARLMETSASGITALNGRGQIIFANREAERILGLSASEIAGITYDDPAWQICGLDGRPFPPEALPFPRVMTEGGTVRNVCFAIAWPDGTKRKLSVNATQIAAEGLSVRVVCSINDITEQVAAEEELRNAAERAEAANRAKSSFLANMSHEIRTPLNGVLGMAQVLEDELSDPRHRRMLSTIRDSGEMLLGVLNDVLDMSKIEAGKLTLEDTLFVPAELAQRVEGLHGLRAAEKGLEFAVQAGADAQIARLGDTGRLAQVLHNLLGNAVKFTETGSVTLILATDPDDALVIEVLDTGVGMTQEQSARIFEDFEQADGTVTRRFGGTGLGMSIVRKLVGLMRGEITVDSAPGRGTDVRVRLPLPRAPLDAVPAIAPEPPRMLSGLRALAADDNATNRMILRAMLSAMGVEVVLVDDGRAAIDAWEPGQFDLYLLDISMPGLDGISALAGLREREAEHGLGSAPALAITANAMSHQVAEYLEAGFAGHLGKPFRREDLMRAIDRATGAVR